MRWSILAFHISAGILGILSGAAAMAFRKGSPLHATAGKVFVIAMLSMAASAVFLATMKHEPIPVTTGVGGWINGLEAWHSPTGSKYGVPAGMHLFMGSVCLLAAVGDVRVLVRGGVCGAKRIMRHLWRMCFGLFIATGSFFLGQGNKVFPAVILRSQVLFIPAVLPLILLIFWLFRVRFTNAYKRMSTPQALRT